MELAHKLIHGFVACGLQRGLEPFGHTGHDRFRLGGNLRLGVADGGDSLLELLLDLPPTSPGVFPRLFGRRAVADSTSASRAPRQAVSPIAAAAAICSFKLSAARSISARCAWA